MTQLAEKLKTELAQLPIEDRAELASFLIESLDEGADRDAEAAWDTELARRADEIRTGKIGEFLQRKLSRVCERSTPCA